MEIRQGALWEGLVAVPHGVRNMDWKVRRRGVSGEVKLTGRRTACNSWIRLNSAQTVLESRRVSWVTTVDICPEWGQAVFVLVSHCRQHQVHGALGPQKNAPLDLGRRERKCHWLKWSQTMN